MITGFPSGFPNGRESVTKRAAMLPAHLRRAGYGTYAVGKWHLTPMHTINPAGPFDHWPLAHGFDRFYGFLGGETDQFRPNLIEDNHVIHPPEREDYHLSEDLTDRAIELLATHRSAAPNRPFFLYLAFGACHGPHQIPEALRDSHRGRYDDGWDAVRRRWFQRQLELGVVPSGTRLPPSNPGIPPWDEVPATDRPLLVRYQELFAAFLHHTDAQIGRLLAALEALDARDDTIVMVMSDNGAAGEGGHAGAWNELIPLNGIVSTPDDSRPFLDRLGGPDSYPIYPTAWAQAGNTPCKWYKHHTFGGGVRAPLIVNWSGMTGGGVHDRFVHAIDIAPTLLSMCAVEPGPTVGGVAQIPLHGVSFHDTLRGDQAARAPTRTQYFEMGGHRGIYHNGWKATTMHQAGASFEDDTWELYDLTSDFSEHDDLATTQPDRLRRLVDLWWLEAGKFGVTPLDDRFLERALMREGHPDHGVRRFALYRGTRRISESAAPNLHGVSFTVRVPLAGFAGEHAGVLMAYGGRFAGFVLHVAERRLVLDQRALDGTTRSLRSDRTIGDGNTVVGLDWHNRDGVAEVTLLIDDAVVARGEGIGMAPFYSGGNGIEVGHNRLSPVAPTTLDEFSGAFRSVEIELAPNEPSVGHLEARLRAD